MTTKKAAVKKTRKKPAKQPVKKKKKSRARRATKSKRSTVSQRVIIQGGGGFGGGGASSSSSSGGGGGIVYLPVPQFQSNALDTTMGVRAPAEPAAAPPPVAEPIEGRRLGTTYAQRRRPNLTNTSGVLFTQAARESKAEPMEQEFKPATTFEPPVFERAAPPAPAEFAPPPQASAPQVFDIGSSAPPRVEPSFAERADELLPVPPQALEQAVEQQPVPALMPANQPERGIVAFDHNRLIGQGRLQDEQGGRDTPASFTPSATGIEMAGAGPARLDYQQNNPIALPAGVQVAGLVRQVEQRMQNRLERVGAQRAAARQRTD